MNDQPKFDTSDYSYGIRPLNPPSQSLPANSSEYARSTNCQSDPLNKILNNDNKIYPGSDEKGWYDSKFGNLQSEVKSSLEYFHNPQKAAEKVTLSPHNALPENHTSTNATPVSEHELAAQGEDLTFMVIEKEKYTQEESEGSQETPLQGILGHSEYHDDDFISYEVRKKLHVGEEAKPVDEIARLEAIVDSCNLFACLSTNDTTTHEDQTIQIKVPNKRGRPRKIQTEKSLSETLNDYLKKSKNKYDKMWFQTDLVFEQFNDMRLSETGQIIPDIEQTQRKKQNPKRNAPGLIFNREIRNMLAFLKKGDYRSKSYIIDILVRHCCETKEFPTFVNYLEGFKVQTRTWESIKAQIKANPSNSFFERILFECIDAFLSSNGEDDFKDWLDDPNAKPKEELKTVLKKCKEEFRNEFRKRFDFRFYPLME